MLRYQVRRPIDVPKSSYRRIIRQELSLNKGNLGVADRTVQDLKWRNGPTIDCST
jgi:hypothetical protein